MPMADDDSAGDEEEPLPPRFAAATTRQQSPLPPPPPLRFASRPAGGFHEATASARQRPLWRRRCCSWQQRLQQPLPLPQRGPPECGVGVFVAAARKLPLLPQVRSSRWEASAGAAAVLWRPRSTSKEETLLRRGLAVLAVVPEVPRHIQQKPDDAERSWRPSQSPPAEPRN